ncbi:MAG: hypothetical protein IIX49_05380, partial [Oscillospiraceae bacterium]|nr:hypothetical protein [Oscillospiraceae bacterium]
MELITVRELFKNTEKYVDKEIEIGGWVRNKRPSKQFGFIVLNDGTYFTPVQVVYNDSIANFQEISKINVGAALIVKGTLVLTPNAKQPFEIQAASVTVEGPSSGDYPLQPKKHSMEFLRSITHLRPRANTFQAVFRVRSLAAMAIHQFFQERDFVYVHTPLITGSDCEGAGEMFQVTTLDLNNIPKTEDGKVDFSQDFYGKPTNLTVSGQLNGETFAMAFRNIYTFGPTFRAENSNTTRHFECPKHLLNMIQKFIANTVFRNNYLGIKDKKGNHLKLYDSENFYTLQSAAFEIAKSASRSEKPKEEYFLLIINNFSKILLLDEELQIKLISYILRGYTNDKEKFLHIYTKCKEETKNNNDIKEIYFCFQIITAPSDVNIDELID